MTQAELSLRLGVSFQQINKYVNNRQVMSTKVLYNVAKNLDCAMEDLYEWEEAGDNE